MTHAPAGAERFTDGLPRALIRADLSARAPGCPALKVPERVSPRGLRARTRTTSASSSYPFNLISRTSNRVARHAICAVDGTFDSVNQISEICNCGRSSIVAHSIPRFSSATPHGQYLIHWSKASSQQFISLAHPYCADSSRSAAYAGPNTSTA